MRYKPQAVQAGGQAAAPATAQMMAVQQAPGTPPASPPPEELIFYTHVLCPYAERVWLVLLEKARWQSAWSMHLNTTGCGCGTKGGGGGEGIDLATQPTLVQGAPFRLVHIDLSHKPDWYRAVNPRMLVPAVQRGGEVVVESADICRWAASTFSQQGQALVPGSTEGRQEMERLIQAGSCVADAGLSLLAGCGRAWGIAGGQTAQQRAAFQAATAPLEQALQGHGGPYLQGQHPTLADLLVYPFLRRVQLGLHVLGEPAVAGSLAAWLAAMAARPAAAIAAGDRERWLAALRQHRSLDWFDYTTAPLLECHPGLASWMTAE